MVDLIAGAIVVAILSLAIAYIVKAKKSGQKCIGCPMSKTCSSHCSCGETAAEANDIEICEETEKENIGTFDSYDGEYEYLDENGEFHGEAANSSCGGGCSSCEGCPCKK